MPGSPVACGRANVLGSDASTICSATSAIAATATSTAAATTTAATNRAPQQPLLGHFDVSHLQLPTNETLTLVTMDDRRASIRFGSAKFLVFQSELSE